jgi:MarR family transcriptional regulator, organic hydroperoxide resistance regulator
VPATADTQQRFSAAWEDFFRTTRRLRVRTGHFPGELTLAQYHLLGALREADERPVGELAEAAGVAPPTATRMLDALARDGYVERRHSQTDRRCVLVTLTPDGEAAVEKAHDFVEGWRRRVFESLEPEEREPAARLLERLSEILEAQL